MRQCIVELNMTTVMGLKKQVNMCAVFVSIPLCSSLRVSLLASSSNDIA